MSLNLNLCHKPIRFCVFIVSLTPLIILVYAYYRHSLGFNPFATLATVTGHCAMVFIVLTLAITPLRRWLVGLFMCFPKIPWGKRLADWNTLIRLRRMLGLYAFFYATLHMFVYLYFEMGFDWHEVLYELQERKFIFIGVTTWVCLLLLAITSPNKIRRAMRDWWRRLHRLMYLLAVLAVSHHYFAVKVTDTLPFIYIGFVVILLLHRILVHMVTKLRRTNDSGMEASR